MEPIVLAYFGVACMVAVSGIGSIYGLSICGNAVVGAMKKSPDKMGLYIALSALPSSQGLYGFVGYMVIAQYLVDGITMITATAILFSGILLGLANLFAGIRQGQICANGVEATASGHNVFAATMVMAVFPEMYSIVALVVSILIAGTLG